MYEEGEDKMADECSARGEGDKKIRDFTEGKILLTRPRRRQYDFQRTYVNQKRDQHLPIETVTNPRAKNTRQRGQLLLVKQLPASQTRLLQGAS